MNASSLTVVYTQRFQVRVFGAQPKLCSSAGVSIGLGTPRLEFLLIESSTGLIFPQTLAQCQIGPCKKNSE